MNGDIVSTGTGATTSSVGISTVTTLHAHGLSVGNRIKLSNITGQVTPYSLVNLLCSENCQ